MRKNSNNKVNAATKDLQKFIEEQKSTKDRNEDLRKKIVVLGAKIKKKQLNFKEIKKIREEKKQKTIEKKTKLQQAGVKERRRR